MNYQWYPGHMTKARRMMEENIRLIDLMLELVDARIPLSSRNPDIQELGKNKARIILLNKSDLADPECNKLWARYFQEQGAFVLEINSKTGAGVRSIHELVRAACKEKLERDRRRGIVNRPVRAMVVGIPNVGKSTFINAFAGKACTKTGNKPGVTKGKQWIRLNKSLELLDTPGILWPKFEDQEVGRRLAYIGSMNDDILLTEELACGLIKMVEERYPGALEKRYGLEHCAAPEKEAALGSCDVRAEDDAPGGCISPEVCIGGAAARESADTLLGIAESRKCALKGGAPDLEKAASILLDDFRSGRLGRMTLELPETAAGRDEKQNPERNPE